jgi:HEAT repeat protein
MHESIQQGIGLIFCLLLACQAGCSKKQGSGAASLADQASSPPAQVNVAAPEFPQPTADVFPPEPTPAETATSSDSSVVDSLATRLSSSLAEIAMLLKNTGNRETAYAAMRDFASNNPASLPEIAALLRTGDPDQAVLGAQGLVALSTPEAMAELLTAIQGAEPGSLKRELSDALASFNNPELAPFLLSLLGTSQEREIAAAVQQALGKSANDAVLQAVVQRYQTSTSASEQDNLIAAVRQMQNATCVEGLLSILSQQPVISSPDPLGLAAMDTLGIIGSLNAVSNLFSYLGSLDDEASSPLSEAIGRVSNPESLSLMAYMAYGQASGFPLSARMAAVQALGNYESNQVFPILNWLVQNDQNTGIREAAGTTLKRVAGQ